MDSLLMALNHQSVFLSQNLDYVQGNGGNISGKTESTIYVKASGKQLRNALNENIFVELALQNLTCDKILANDSFSQYLTDSTLNHGLVPSIETNFHLLFPQKYVIHLHTFWSILIGSLELRKEIFQDFVKRNKILLVPYRRPGVELVNAINSSRQDSGEQNEICILRNHGIIIASNSLDQISEMLPHIENEIKKLLSKLPLKSGEAVSNCKIGFLTPDHAVFSLLNSSSSAVAETKEFYSRIMKTCEILGLNEYLVFLSEKEVRLLLGWDREKTRMEMIR